MRNLKKFLALVLAMLMVVSAGATVSAYSDVAEDDAYAAAIAALTEYGIVNGTELGEAEDGSDALFEPDADVTRWQMALMMARALAPEVTNEEWAEGMEIFTDVDQWYGAIAYAYVEGIINGVSTEDLVFKPNDGIKYQDGLIMALRALGYEVECPTGKNYWIPAWTQAKQLGLTENIAISNSAKTMTRGEMAQLIYNMVNLPFADGSASLAVKYYGAANVDNTTTFVITATPKQAYVKGQHIDETQPDGYEYETLIGIQELEAGIPAGDILYIPAADVGIEAADVENYFHYAVELYNYEAETGYYSAGAVITDSVKVLRNHDGFVANGTTVKVGGYTYYPVASLTDAALRNEIVVFTGDAGKKDSLVLLKNKDGNIVNFDGDVVATYVYTLGSTNYYVAENLDSDKNEGKDNVSVISESTALARFGVKTEDNAVFTEYETKTASSLKEDGNKGTSYQLTFFDDDNDGKYERAIYDTVYMSVYNKVDSGKQETKGPWQTTDANDRKGVTFTDTAVQSKGTIFTYTYNPQLKVVNVIDILGTKEGVLTNVDLSKNNGDNNNTITLTIGGKKYIVAHSNTDYLMGADVQTNASTIAWKNIKDDAQLAYNYGNVEDLYYIGQTYEFYEYNGYLIQARDVTPNEDKDFLYFVSNGAVSYDSTGLYVDGYINGEEVEIEISAIDTNADDGFEITLEKDTAIADMNIFELGEFLAKAKDVFNEGNLFKVILKADGTYKLLSDAFEYAPAATNTEFVLVDASGRHVFDNGKSDNTNKAKRLRTDDDTVFYFINTDNGAVDIYVGEPEDEWEIKSTATVYANKFGYGSDKWASGIAAGTDMNGTADTVFVYYASAKNDIVGFNITAQFEDITIVWVANLPQTSSHYIVDGDEVDGSDTYYHKYTDAPAINMLTGATIGTIYSEKAIVDKKDADGNVTQYAYGFYKIDEDGVVTRLDKEELEDYITTEKIDVDDNDFTDEFLEFGSVTDDNEIETVVTYKNTTKIKDTKTNKTDYLTDGAWVSYLKINAEDDEDVFDVDGKLIVVVTTADIEAPGAPVVNKTDKPSAANATFYWNMGKANQEKYYATVAGLEDDKLDDLKVSIWTNTDTSKLANISDKLTMKATVSIDEYDAGTTSPNKNSKDYTVDITVDENGVISVPVIVEGMVTDKAVTLTAGKDYAITIYLGCKDTNTRCVVIDPFAN